MNEVASAAAGSSDLQVQKRQAIVQLEAAMKQLPPDQLLDVERDTPVRHFFAPGVYGREIFIPAGVLLIGAIHRHSHLNIISAGRCLVASEFGDKEIVAPFTYVSEPGIKRAIHALDDTVWTTIHHNPDDLTDLDAIEAIVIAPDYQALQESDL